MTGCRVLTRGEIGVGPVHPKCAHDSRLGVNRNVIVQAMDRREASCAAVKLTIPERGRT